MLQSVRARWKLLTLAALVCLVLLGVGISLLIGHQVRGVIDIAQAAESGDSVTALLAMANSTRYPLSARNRAIWALGQLGDPRALEPLEQLSTGEECDHASDLCQHELVKAIGLCRGGRNVGALIWRHGDLVP